MYNLTINCSSKAIPDTKCVLKCQGKALPSLYAFAEDS